MTYRFIRALVTPFNKTKAFEFGIIDADGNPLRKKKDLETREEKNSYTVYDRLIFKLKRLMGKIPGGSTRLASYAAALWLIKENVCESDCDRAYIFEEQFAEHIKLSQTDYDTLLESAPAELVPGRYVVVSEDINELFEGTNTGDVVEIKNSNPVDCILGVSLFKAYNPKTNEELVVSYEEIQQIFI